MEFKLIIDPTAEETVTATVHKRSALTEEIELLVMQYAGTDRITGYTEDDVKVLRFGEIDCVFVEGGKTYAAASDGEVYLLKLRLFEAQGILPDAFVKINKSAIGNLGRIKRFTASFAGGVDAVFQCGHKEYVSRRCFAKIKRRLEK